MATTIGELLDRERELGVLGERFERAAAGESGVVVIEGDAGFTVVRG